MISATPGRPWPTLARIWRTRELLYFLAWRDIKARYKQTYLGVSWALLKPLLTMVVFSVVFGHFAHVPSGGAPYPIFSYCGLLPWLFFSQATTQSSLSLIANVQIITKVYFPREVIPLSAVLGCLMDLGVGSVLLGALMLYYGERPTAALLALPVGVLMAVVSACGTGLLLSSLSVRHRDIAHVVPFLVQVWMFVTPVIYPVTIFPAGLRLLLSLNPAAGAVDMFRWGVLGSPRPDLPSLLVSGATAVALLVAGLVHFQAVEPGFADVA